MIKTIMNLSKIISRKSGSALTISLTLALALTGLGVTQSEAAPKKLPDGYTVETINIPGDIVLGVGGLTFDSKGRLFICTREGEIWIHVPETSQWKLFADGLHEPLGLWMEPDDSALFVMQRPELTRLVDEDGDDSADLYESVNHAWGLTDNYHEYAFGPVRGKDGEFYGALNTSLSWPGWAGSDRWDVARVHDSKMGRAAPFRGWSFQISPEGKFVPWSFGMRSPAGLGWGPDGELFYTDNQGDWNPSSTLQHVVKGRFHGHPSSLMDHPAFRGKDLNSISVEEYTQFRTPPAVYFPHGELANSPGEPTLDTTEGKFGPFAGQIFVGDQSLSNLMRIDLEKVSGQYQGAIFNFIAPLQCGVIRNVFGPDGSLWVGQTGRGWGSLGGKLFGLERIRWDGKTQPMEMKSIHLTRGGFRVEFTQPVQPESISAESIQVQHWGYHYRPEYGSPKVDLTKLELNKESFKVVSDRVIEINIPKLQTGKVYEIATPGVLSADGRNVTNVKGWYTLNYLKDK